MAKKAGSKSQAIRDYIAANPNAGPTEIYNALTKKGIAVSKGLVAVVKYKKPSGAKGKAGGRKRGRKAAARKATKASGGSLSASDLIAAKQLADSLGGVAKAREALELLEKLS